MSRLFILVEQKNKMETYISILRGINVSGHKLIKMDALKKMFEDLNFKNIRTYIQSGNVIFESKKVDTKSLETIIGKQIFKTFGFEVPVLVKEKKDWKTVFENNPFLKNRNEDISKLHVTFLSAEPEQVNIDKLLETKFNNDEFVVSENVVYLFCPDGYGNTKLSNTFFENKLKVSATTRNWKTVIELNKLTDL